MKSADDNDDVCSTKWEELFVDDINVDVDACEDQTVTHIDVYRVGHWMPTPAGCGVNATGDHDVAAGEISDLDFG